MMNLQDLNYTGSKFYIYPKAIESLQSYGYTCFSNKEIQGIGRQGNRKPDYIAIKDDMLVIGEIKSKDEGPKTSSWRIIQNNDSKKMKKVRAEINEKEKKGEYDKKIGGHIIIIQGQIKDYWDRAGITYKLPVDKDSRRVYGGYSLPISEKSNVEEAFRVCEINVFERIESNNIISFIFALD